MDCLGEEILPDMEKYTLLCERFNVRPRLVKRATNVDMLIGQHGNHLHSDTVVKSIDGMKLLDGPLGKTFAGVDRSGLLGGTQFSSNFFTSAIINPSVIAIDSSQVKYKPTPIGTFNVVTEFEASVLSDTLLCNISREFLNYFKEEGIGVDCNPKCGNCQ